MTIGSLILALKDLQYASEVMDEELVGEFNDLYLTIKLVRAGTAQTLGYVRSNPEAFVSRAEMTTLMTLFSHNVLRLVMRLQQILQPY